MERKEGEVDRGRDGEEMAGRDMRGGMTDGLISTLAFLSTAA